MCSQHDDPTQHDICSIHPNDPQREGFCGQCLDDYLTRDYTSFAYDREEKTSPWVRRNTSYAQYHQPRGSQYEG